jgi:hypothetical protein
MKIKAMGNQKKGKKGNGTLEVTHGFCFDRS